MAHQGREKHVPVPMCRAPNRCSASGFSQVDVLFQRSDKKPPHLAATQHDKMVNVSRNALSRTPDLPITCITKWPELEAPHLPVIFSSSWLVHKLSERCWSKQLGGGGDGPAQPHSRAQIAQEPQAFRIYEHVGILEANMGQNHLLRAQANFRMRQKLYKGRGARTKRRETEGAKRP